MISEKFSIEGPRWLLDEGDEKSIVFSTKIIYERNIAGYPFPTRARSFELNIVQSKVAEAMNHLPPHITVINSTLKDVEKAFLQERHIYAGSSGGRNSITYVAPDESDHIVVNANNHLALAFYAGGFEPYSVYSSSASILSTLSEDLEFAWTKKWGYVTSSPFMMGTGMRISFALHLWGTSLLGQLNRLEDVLPKANMGIRGFFGERVDVIGYFFVVFTQKSLGVSEEEVIEIGKNSVKKLIEIEEEARQELIKRARVQIEDKIARSLGILRYSRLLGIQEALSLLANLKIGFDADLVSGDSQQILTLFTLVQPAHIVCYMGATDNDQVSIDSIRAELVKDKLRDIELKLE